MAFIGRVQQFGEAQRHHQIAAIVERAASVDEAILATTAART
jgi:hypothetical protein